MKLIIKARRPPAELNKELIELIESVMEQGMIIDKKKTFVEIGNQKIYFTEGILDVIQTEKEFIIITDVKYAQKNLLEIWNEQKIIDGNILAYSLKGDFLWKIGQLVDNLIFPFSMGHILTQTEKHHYEEFFGIVFHREHEYFVGITIADERYIIDLTSQSFVKKILTK